MSKAFIKESLAIEGIHRDPTKEEIAEHERFMRLEKVTVEDLIQFVSVYERGEHLRTGVGYDVYIGGRRAPRGCGDIKPALQAILDVCNKSKAWPAEACAEAAYDLHVAYELLHPFTDCNGRSGRMLWAWMMGPRYNNLGFLHRFYYQALQCAARTQ